MRGRGGAHTLALVKTFLVEHYWPGVTADEFGAATERVRTGTEQLVSEGLGIRFLHSTLVPQDESGFCVLEAESQALVEEAYMRAGVRFERIVESVDPTLAVGDA